jgi:serine/threonine protein kinase
MHARNSKCKPRCFCGDHKYDVRVHMPSSRSEDDNKKNGEFTLFIDAVHENNEPLSATLSKKIVERAKLEIKEIAHICRTNALAKFHIQELAIGPLLGSGGFSNVFEIAYIHPLKSDDSQFDDEQLNLRRHAIDAMTSNSNLLQSPYAVKLLRRKLMNNPKRFANGAIDLTLEGVFLSSFQHPNILKLHGMSADGPEGYYRGRHDSYFLIVDRLSETLQDRILHWRMQLKKLNSAWVRHTDRKGKKRRSFMIKRLQVAADIASALTYLHSRRLIYRDLKPLNIGFDIHNQVKIFDFGLCTELPLGEECGFQYVHKMTGGIGTYGYVFEIANHSSNSFVRYASISVTYHTLFCLFASHHTIGI